MPRHEAGAGHPACPACGADVSAVVAAEASAQRRRAAQTRSPARAEASRANGRKGGRPRKSTAPTPR